MNFEDVAELLAKNNYKPLYIDGQEYVIYMILNDNDSYCLYSYKDNLWLIVVGNDEGLIQYQGDHDLAIRIINKLANLHSFI